MIKDTKAERSRVSLCSFKSTFPENSDNLWSDVPTVTALIRALVNAAEMVNRHGDTSRCSGLEERPGLRLYRGVPVDHKSSWKFI